ncbi:hypothetical protein GE061_014095 [Apolygus lucorum]|uniref:Uncharacterized protein n=1 Tax=Apolygus lucorum TaxID=248454 RepID=A0A8S9XPJ5_APOLU|nr:hypothetical protein GE061_014095 [Apolygus lucorum]
MVSSIIGNSPFFGKILDSLKRGPATGTRGQEQSRGVAAPDAPAEPPQPLPPSRVPQDVPVSVTRPFVVVVDDVTFVVFPSQTGAYPVTWPRSWPWLLFRTGKGAQDSQAHPPSPPPQLPRISFNRQAFWAANSLVR